MVGEDVCEEGTSTADSGSVGGDGGGHGVVAADAYAEDYAPDCEPDERAGGGDGACGVADAHDRGEDDEHEFFAV